MKTAQRWSLTLGIAVVTSMALAQEPAGDPATRTPPSAPPSSQAPAPPAQGASPAPTPTDDVFIPSEEVQADEELAFPVDI
jgi:hypothetical protein